MKQTNLEIAVLEEINKDAMKLVVERFRDVLYCAFDCFHAGLQRTISFYIHTSSVGDVVKPSAVACFSHDHT